MLFRAADLKTPFSLAWVVALGLLAGLSSPAASAQSTEAPSRDRAAELQQLANSLAHQIGMLQRFDRPAAEAIYFRLGEAIDAWEVAGRTDDDFQKMHDWLTQALATAMPGARRTAPPIPEFSPPATAAVARSGSGAPSVDPPSTEPDAKLPRKSPTHRDSLAGSPAPEASSSAPELVAPSQRSEAGEAPELPLQKSVWARHPAARPADLGNPFTDDPLGGERTPAEQVVLRPRTTGPPSVQSQMQINLAALGARTRGYNRGLRAIEARLVASPGMGAEELLLLAMELKELAAQRELVALHLESLPPDLASKASQPASLNEVKSLMESRTEQLRGESRRASLMDDVFAEQESPALVEIEKLLQQI